MKKFHILVLLLGLSLSTAAWAGELTLRWLGHAAFELTTKAGKTVLVDPWITNPKAPKGVTFKKVDLILVTHGHSDHVGEAFALAKKFNAPLVASYELTLIAQAQGVKTTQPLNPQGSATFGDLTVTAVNAVHSSGYTPQGSKTVTYAGAPLGFIISEEGEPVIYHAGDTGVFGDMALIGEMYHPDVALIPVGGVFTMRPAEGAVAAKLLKAKTVVPMHWGTFPMLTGTPAELKSEMEKAGAPGKMMELKIGTPVNVKELL